MEKVCYHLIDECWNKPACTEYSYTLADALSMYDYHDGLYRLVKLTRSTTKQVTEVVDVKQVRAEAELLVLTTIKNAALDAAEVEDIQASGDITSCSDVYLITIRIPRPLRVL